MDLQWDGISAATLLPPLDAMEERRVDLRKWAAIRGGTRIMLDDLAARAMLKAFVARASRESLAMEAFSERQYFYVLRRELFEMGAGRAHHQSMLKLEEALVAGASTADCLSLIETSNWSCPLRVALMQLLNTGPEALSGGVRSDPLFKALCEWFGPWEQSSLKTDAGMRRDLELAVQRYLAHRNTMVQHNTRLVLKLAREFSTHFFSVEDLFQEGFLGLVRAAEKFDYRQGNKFSTYAYQWIRQFIVRFTESGGSIIDFPSNVRDDINRVYRYRMQCIDAGEGEPALGELAQATGIKPDKLFRLRQLGDITLSLDTSPSDEETAPLIDQVSALYEGKAESYAETSLLKQSLQQRLQGLREFEQQVVIGRWGLRDGVPRTLGQLAEQFNVSSEWVRQTEKTALGKLSADQQLRRLHEELE